MIKKRRILIFLKSLKLLDVVYYFIKDKIGLKKKKHAITRMRSSVFSGKFSLFV